MLVWPLVFDTKSIEINAFMANDCFHAVLYFYAILFWKIVWANECWWIYFCLTSERARSPALPGRSAGSQGSSSGWRSMSPRRRTRASTPSTSSTARTDSRGSSTCLVKVSGAFHFLGVPIETLLFQFVNCNNVIFLGCNLGHAVVGWQCAVCRPHFVFSNFSCTLNLMLCCLSVQRGKRRLKNSRGWSKWWIGLECTDCCKLVFLLFKGNVYANTYKWQPEKI